MAAMYRYSAIVLLPSNLLESIYHSGVHIAIAYYTNQVRAVHELKIKIELRLGSNWTRTGKLARGRCNMYGMPKKWPERKVYSIFFANITT